MDGIFGSHQMRLKPPSLSQLRQTSEGDQEMYFTHDKKGHRVLWSNLCICQIPLKLDQRFWHENATDRQIYFSSFNISSDDYG